MQIDRERLKVFKDKGILVIVWYYRKNKAFSITATWKHTKNLIIGNETI